MPTLPTPSFLRHAARPLAALGLFVIGCAAQAGRPLMVDDANVNDPGHGHVEIWQARDAARSRIFNVAPAWSPLKDLELSATLSRDRTLDVSASTLQAKWRITESRADGCNLGSSFGLMQTSGLSNGGFINALLSCNGLLGNSLHLNIGRNDRPGSRGNSGGLALEREFGPVVAHIEAFGATGARAGRQVGLRWTPAEGWQLDGTWGRQSGQSIVSLGLKRQF